jgi:hypothetical protein
VAGHVAFTVDGKADTQGDPVFTNDKFPVLKISRNQRCKSAKIREK